MSHRNARIFLWLTASALFLATGIVIDHWVLRNAINTGSSENGPVTPLADTSMSKLRPSVSLLGEKDFVYVWNKRLRRALVDEAPTKVIEPVLAPPVTAAVEPLPEITLVATFVETEPALSQAWLVLPKGIRRLVRIGQSLDGLPGPPLIEQIEDRRVVIKWQNTFVTKELPPNVSKRFENL